MSIFTLYFIWDIFFGSFQRKKQYDAATELRRLKREREKDVQPVAQEESYVKYKNCCGTHDADEIYERCFGINSKFKET